MSPAVEILAVNMLAVIGVGVFGWSALTLLLLYWIENLVVGAFNAVKMLIAGASAGRAQQLAAMTGHD